MNTTWLLSAVVGLVAGSFISVSPTAAAVQKISHTGGHVRVTPSFEAELVTTSPGSIAIFLFDLKYHHASVRNSTLEAMLEQNGLTIAVTCSPSEFAFHCDLPIGAMNENGTLVIRASREGSKEAVARYALPLKNQN